MTCPFCQAQFKAATPARCPECGCEVMRLTSGLIKTSAVMIASAGTRAVYRSVQEVPEPLRRRLMESTQGVNSATIVIADHGGREHMEKSVEPRGEAAGAAPAPAAETPQATAAEPAPSAEQAVPGSAEAPLARSRARLIGVALAGVALAAAAAWLLHGLQW